MSDYSMQGWKGRAAGEAIQEDKYKHAKPLRTAEYPCPACGDSQEMTCYEFADGPFGIKKCLHLICAGCNGKRTLDKKGNDEILSRIRK
jgi:hypothetical protein